jgi:hypothetical protein
MKIINQDKHINITYELSHLEEEYNAAKQNYEETKNPNFLNKIHELQPKMNNLRKMALEREKDEVARLDSDRVSQINKKTLEKQKLNDMNLLNRKKYREGEVIMNKRKDCKPVNLFDSGNLKQEENEQKNEEKDFFENTQMDSAQKNKIVMKLIQEKVKLFSEDIDQIVKTKKAKIKTRKDDEYMFEILKINPDIFATLVESHNLKLKSKGGKIISINEINY